MSKHNGLSLTDLNDIVKHYINIVKEDWKKEWNTEISDINLFHKVERFEKIMFNTFVYSN
jgi:hypothetical protein